MQLYASRTTLFIINNVPVGRHSVRATYIGYEPVLLKEQLVSSSKELVLTLRMRESISRLGEVIVKPRVNKQQPLNEMAQVGARMFSVEEATRITTVSRMVARCTPVWPIQELTRGWP